MIQPLAPELLQKMHAWWRAANYLCVGQIYLMDNPLLKQPLKIKHVKPRLLGHWGTSPGLNFVYVHLNRIIREHDLDVIYVTGPGHGGPALVANTYLEGTYSEFYPKVSQDEAGLQRLFTQFSFPGGIPSHVAAETPGSINEGGELGYCLTHAYGAAFDDPDLLVACVVGDGEAETGALAANWHSNKFLNPVRDGAVLPILHLNGYKIASASLLSRISRQELEQLFRGYGYEPHFVEGDDPDTMHQLMAQTLDRVVEEIRQIQTVARSRGFTRRLADDHLAHAQGLDRTQGGGRPEDRRHMAFAPGAPGQSAKGPAAPAVARTVVEELSPGRIIRRGREIGCRRGEPGAEGRSAHGREPARQRRVAFARPRPSRFSRLRRQASRAGRRHGRIHAPAGRVPARRDEGQRSKCEFPRVRAG